MGEAKRRKLAAGRVIEYRDETTGERITVRNAGDPLKFFTQEVTGRGERELNGDRSAVNVAVPCAGCRECCYHAGVDIHPEDEPPETLAILQTERRADGMLYLRKREDGACVHLGPEGCTIYDHRPRACRSYDCRLYALINVLDSFSGDHVQQRWVFEPRDRKSAAFHGACMMMGMVKLNQIRRETGECSANDAAGAVFNDLDGLLKVAEAFLELANLSPDQRAKAMGFDPRTVTAEQMREAMNTMSGGRAEVMVRVDDQEKP